MKKILLLGLVLCATGAAAFAVEPGATIAQGGGRADVYYRDGARFALEGRLTEAANAFEQAVALDPTNGNAFYSLGNVYSELGRWADAVNAYYKAISLKKDDIEAYNNLGIALNRRGQNVQAAAAFERAIKIYPKWAEPFYHLSQVRRELHEDAAAQQAYDRAIRLRPDYATQPPRTFMTAGTKTSMTASTKAVALPRSKGPETASNVNLGSVVSENINAAPRTTPDSGAPARAASTVTGETVSATGQTASAMGETASNSVRSDKSLDTRAEPLDTRSFYDLGLREARAGRHDEAVAAFRQAILLDRKNAAAYLALGDEYAAQGNWRESVDAYEQASRLNPNDAETYQRLGRSYAKLRETTPAPEMGRGASASGLKTAAPSNATADVEGTPRVESMLAKTHAPTATTEDDVDPTALYRVGPGDVLDVSVLNGREHRTTSHQVTPAGLLDFSKLSTPLKVAGLTTEQIAAQVRSELMRFNDSPTPEIAVGVREYVSHAIIVSGMVKEAGTKILQREGVPLYVIIAYAQPLPGAGQALVVAHSTGRSTAVDLSDARALKMLVRPGDVIDVRTRPEQYVYIAGAVRQPGQKRFHVGLTLTQALLAAGGALPSGTTVVAVTRQDSDGRLETTRYNLPDINAGRTPDPLIQPGDRVEVLR
ncbi:MAG: protein O-GlcNAc transferase [Acidobacteriota bacterium]|nr:protein O-GlcNAc transferase [Acidobacteriota bacterium]